MKKTKKTYKKNSLKLISKGNKGITLIALIITIIVLLILAGVTVATLTGNNGLLTKAGETKKTTEKLTEKERIQVEMAGGYDTTGRLDADIIVDIISKNVSDVTQVISTSGKFPVKVTYSNGHKYQVTENGNVFGTIDAGETAPSDSNVEYVSGKYTAIIPAGFTVSSTENSIETGLVINDDSGNEFVWIPVEIPWISDPSKKIELGRYEFEKSDEDNSGRIVQFKTDGSALRPSGFSKDFIEEEKRETGTSNAVAKDIKQFITNTKNAKGFWIGRYEARKKTKDGKTIVTENKDDNVYYINSQPDAAIAARGMYGENSYFQSDLINSYAWDTATLFLQEYDNRKYNSSSNSNYKKKYSNQIRITEQLNNKGTIALADESKIDKICNVYDMSSNCWEWSTETYGTSGTPGGVLRGGAVGRNKIYTSSRSDVGITTSVSSYPGFRPILYILN